ncbi:M15 family metallopeptidase [Anabaena lutea]|uniref:M15 family metallopeptidase n=1 Tax=Anabaena lutea TaxID=212350 RepID=UPI001F5530F4|nr:M15 family metallopeptidase [Anabaena lutea]
MLNGYAVMQFVMRSLTHSLPTPSPSISQPLKIIPSASVANTNIQVASLQKQERVTAYPPKFGHFPYSEGDTEKMIIIGSYAQHEYQRFEQLAPEAALALMKLIYAARDEGVWIIPVSGFRSIATQDKLFQSQIQRRGSPEAAAKLSAPPGYSEHHTGYALDLADGHFPKQDVTYNFANTDAFRWLSQHGKEFGFELSFPANNLQGVSYEPWHWRFIGSPNAVRIFARAKQTSSENQTLN